MQTYAEMDPTTAALEKEHEAVRPGGGPRGLGGVPEGLQRTLRVLGGAPKGQGGPQGPEGGP